MIIRIKHILQPIILKIYNIKIEKKVKQLQILRTKALIDKKLIYNASFILNFQSLAISIKYAL